MVGVGDDLDIVSKSKLQLMHGQGIEYARLCYDKRLMSS